MSSDPQRAAPFHDFLKIKGTFAKRLGAHITLCVCVGVKRLSKLLYFRFLFDIQTFIQ